PEQARPADRRRMADRPYPFGCRRRPDPPLPRTRVGLYRRASPPRALRRYRLSRPAGRRADPAGRAHRRGRRRLLRHDLRPGVPRRPVGTGGDRRAAPVRRYPVRPRRRRRPRRRTALRHESGGVAPENRLWRTITSAGKLAIWASRTRAEKDTDG